MNYEVKGDVAVIRMNDPNSKVQLVTIKLTEWNPAKLNDQHTQYLM